MTCSGPRCARLDGSLSKDETPCRWLDLPRLPLLRILEIVHASSSLQNPACVCRAWHTAAHEIRLGDTASSRPLRRMAASQESAQQAHTLQTCAGIFVAEGASSGFEACSRPRWRQDQNATSAGRQQRAALADDVGVAAWTAVTEAGPAAAGQPDADTVSERPSLHVSAQAGPADVGSPSTAAASGKRRREQLVCDDTAAPQPQRRCLRRTTRAAVAAGAALQPAPRAAAGRSGSRGVAVLTAHRDSVPASPASKAKTASGRARERSAAAKLHAARLAAENPSAMHVSDEGSPSAEVSDFANSDANGAELLARDAAHGGGGAAASTARQGFAHWLLSLVPGRRR